MASQFICAPAPFDEPFNGAWPIGTGE